jgi:hypothetical protein
VTAAVRLAPYAAAAAIVLGAPLIGLLRGALFAAVPSAYVAILVSGTLVGGALVLGSCLRRIRERRAPRLALLALAPAAAAVAIALLRSGDANIDAVEAFHVVEYSALTLLWFRPRGVEPRWEPYARAGLAALAVGIADEWFQWFVPGRAGELHDVLFDAVAIGCGLIVCGALDARIWSTTSRHDPAMTLAARLPVGALAACVIVGLGAFVAAVHLGYEIRDPEIGVFRSRFSAPRLAQLGAARAAAWRGGPPPEAGRYSREDQFEAEALWHVRRRNAGMDPDRRGDRAELDVAWHENLILERYFAVVLHAPPRPGATGHRLAPEQRLRLDAARAPDPAPFVSDAEAQPLFVWSRPTFWASVIGGAAMVWGVERQARVRRRTSGDAVSQIERRDVEDA